MNNYKDWIGKKISRSDIITPRLVDHLKKTIDQNCLSDQTVPEGIFLCLCPDVSSIIDLDKDGNTKLGIFLPELPYKIRMWAGGKIKIFDKFKIGFKKSASAFTSGLKEIIVKKEINDENLSKIEEFLIQSDVGVEAASEIKEIISKKLHFYFVMRISIQYLIFLKKN